jgi:hypothetical protein
MMDGGAAGNGRAVMTMVRAADDGYAEIAMVERGGGVRL